MGRSLRTIEKSNNNVKICWAAKSKVGQEVWMELENTELGITVGWHRTDWVKILIFFLNFPEWENRFKSIFFVIK